MSTTVIPQFYFPKASKRTNDTTLLMKKIKSAFQQHEYMTDLEFESVTTLCSLPRFMNLALFRAIDMLNDQNDILRFEHVERSWPVLIQEHIKKSSIDDIHSLMYFILKKPGLDCLTPDDFLPVLEDIVLNHPALQFLEDNITFQERYIETVICRMFYNAHCPSGKLTLANFTKSGIASLIQNLTPSVDLYTTRNIFSYKQFYVLYCKLWSLDTDHDLSITETDLCNYNMGALARLAIERVMQTGHIAAFAETMLTVDDHETTVVPVADRLSRLTYFDFIWFLLSEVDKSTPMAIHYWFRCLDIDDDGVLSSYELSQFWQDQSIKHQCHDSVHVEDRIQFDDIMRQMNDLIQPKIPGQFTEKDLKKSGFLAERFFDTFINFDRFQVHESHQEGSIREQQAYRNKQVVHGTLAAPAILTDELGSPVLSDWDDFADVEYQRIILDANYTNSYQEKDQQNVSNRDDNDDDSSVSSTSSTRSKTEDLSNKATITGGEAETDSNDDEEEYDDFEDILNLPCIFNPTTLANDNNKISNDLNNTTTSYYDLKTEQHHHHHQHNISFIH